jgi:hypothetical protein
VPPSKFNTLNEKTAPVALAFRVFIHTNTKMPPKKVKEGDSKKNQQKKKAQTIDDKTFGLKNKNKSKKVQGFIQSVQKSVLNSGDPKQRKLEEDRAKAKAIAKAVRKAAKDEQDALFGAALLAISKKGTTDQKEGKIEAKGRDADDEGKKKNTSRAMKMMFQMDAQEMDEKLREDVSVSMYRGNTEEVPFVCEMSLTSTTLSIRNTSQITLPR